MKHKQYERWIFNEAFLTPIQQRKLDEHIKDCDHCRLLYINWIASKQLILHSIEHTPAPGFVERWQKKIILKRRNEKVRRHRLTIFGFLVLAFISSLIYMLVSRSFMHIFANGFNAVSEIFIWITNGLSVINIWFSRLPIAVPFAVGFLFFGMISALTLTLIFFLWNIKQRKLLQDEISMD